jgi:hypothetical protein
MFNLVRRCIWVYLPVEAIMNRIWNYLGGLVFLACFPPGL